MKKLPTIHKHLYSLKQKLRQAPNRNLNEAEVVAASAFFKTLRNKDILLSLA